MIGRVKLVRRNAYMAPSEVIRRRGIRVVECLGWVLLIVPRNHWSEHL